MSLRTALSGSSGALLDALVLCALVGLVTIAANLLLGAGGSRIMIVALAALVSCLGLQIFSGLCGDVSFGHAGFAAVGAYTAGILTLPVAVQAMVLPNLPDWLSGWALSLLPALVAALMAGVVTAALAGSLLVRLVGDSVAIATLALMVILNTIIVGARDITRGSQPLFGVPRLSTVPVVLAVACIAILVARLLRDTPVGRAARAQREDIVGAKGCGINVRKARFVTFVVSGALTSVGGALLALYLGAFAPKDFYFAYGVTVLAMLIVGGMRSVAGAVTGVLFITMVTEALRSIEGGGHILGIAFPAVFGLPQFGLALAMIMVIWLKPSGLTGGRELNLWRLFALQASANSDTIPPINPTTLRVQGLTKSFGGVRAVRDVSFEAEGGQITGLIGPNGAGKTTLINLISGQIRADAGAVELGGRDVVSLSDYGVARAGMARTYQNLRVFADMTVEENVLTAAEAHAPTKAEARKWTEVALSHFDLQADRFKLANALPYGHRRRLEIARALATRPLFLLIDEPAAGMNPVETADLIGRLRVIRDDLRVGILIVEHDMSLIMNLCDRVAVMDRGSLIAFDAPRMIAQDQHVIDAYLGSKRTRTTKRETLHGLGASIHNDVSNPSIR